MSDREYWLSVPKRVSMPVLTALAEHRLKKSMPVYARQGQEADRAQYTHLEALGRSLCGIAPWLELDETTGPESELQFVMRKSARAAIDAATHPDSPDKMNFTQGGQPVVDAAFLAHALIRSPRQLWQNLDAATQRNLVQCLLCTRSIRPGFSNWLLFSAMIEAALCMMGEPFDKMRIDYAVRQHEQWYKGDGMYGDGPSFHFDYYNSYVIQPMLLDVLETLGKSCRDFEEFKEPVLKRAVRYAHIQEMLISPDGTFPPIGRSICYRGGAFQLLAQIALREKLPAPVLPAQVRCALTAVMKKTLEAPGTFDKDGWLQIGLAGKQPGLGEGYISTGSLYLCTACLLPLGLPATNRFWSEPDTDWTSRKIWAGQDASADHAI